jgi:hypothetical protein
MFSPGSRDASAANACSCVFCSARSSSSPLTRLSRKRSSRHSVSLLRAVTREGKCLIDEREDLGDASGDRMSLPCAGSRCFSELWLISSLVINVAEGFLQVL